MERKMFKEPLDKANSKMQFLLWKKPLQVIRGFVIVLILPLL